MQYWSGRPIRRLIRQELVKNMWSVTVACPVVLPWLASKRYGVCRIYKQIQRDLWNKSNGHLTRAGIEIHKIHVSAGIFWSTKYPWWSFSKYIADIAAYLVIVFNLFHLIMTYPQVWIHSNFVKLEVVLPSCILRWFEERPILMLQGPALARILGIAGNIEEERLGLRDGGWTWCAQVQVFFQKALLPYESLNILSHKVHVFYLIDVVF